MTQRWHDPSCMAASRRAALYCCVDTPSPWPVFGLLLLKKRIAKTAARRRARSTPALPQTAASSSRSSRSALPTAITVALALPVIRVSPSRETWVSQSTESVKPDLRSSAAVPSLHHFAVCNDDDDGQAGAGNHQQGDRDERQIPPVGDLAPRHRRLARASGAGRPRGRASTSLKRRPAQGGGANDLLGESHTPLPPENVPWQRWFLVRLAQGSGRTTLAFRNERDCSRLSPTPTLSFCLRGMAAGGAFLCPRIR